MYRNGLSEEQTEFTDSVLESAKFLLTIINDKLDFSKIESGHMDVESIPFYLHKLISDVVVPLRLQAKEKGPNLTSNCYLQPDYILLGDAWRMRQIITTLVGNALKFTEEGEVNLTVRTIANEEPGKMMVQFVVHNNRIGIDESVMKALFTPFHQADNTTARLHGGTGLGLLICRQLDELMGGRLDLESLPGEGTTATCDIPFLVYDGPVSGALTATTLPRRARLSNKSIEAKVHQPSPNGATNNSGKKQSTISIISTCTEPDVRILLGEDNLIIRKVISLAIK